MMLDQHEQAIWDEAHQDALDKVAEKKPGCLRRLTLIAGKAIQEHFALPNNTTVRRIATEEHLLYGQDPDRDYLIKHGNHSMNEIKTKLSDAVPQKLL